MSDKRQLRLAKWERTRQRGMWRFVLLRGVLGFGVTMGLIGMVFERVAWGDEAFPWYFIFGLWLAGGFVWGIATWFLSMKLYSRAPKLE